MDQITTIELTADWLKVADNDNIYTIKNNSGNPVLVGYSLDASTPPDPNSNITSLGGHNSKVTLSEVYIWAKHLENKPAAVKVIPFGLADPEEDITQLANAINDATVRLNNHLNALSGNPHRVTKDEVGLGNIPNSISDDPENMTNDTLATIKAANDLLNRLEAHKSATGNVHNATKADIGLEYTPNMPIGDTDNVLDPNNNNVLMTPMLTHHVVGRIVEASSLAPAQSIVEAVMGSRITGWSNKDCDLPTNHIVKVSPNTVKILAGLICAYASNGKSLISIPLAQDAQLTLTNMTDGFKYIFAEFSNLGAFVSFGFSTNRPSSGVYRDSYPYDFFNRAKGIMYDSSGNPVKRVYIGKVLVQSADIIAVYPCPIGNKYIAPITTTLALGTRYLFINPFIEKINCTAEVEYSLKWGNSGWNDQIGVVANADPNDPEGSIVVQVGSVGFLADGRSAGSPFGSSFTTVATPLRTRVKITMDR